MRTPTNNADYEAQYENIAHWLAKAGAPSDVLGYAENLYQRATQTKDLAMFIRQFISRLSGYDDPKPSIVDRATSYLKKKDLLGNPLR